MAKKTAPKPPPRRPRVVINFVVEPPVLEMLNSCQAILAMSSVSRTGRAITRSHVIRQAIERLYDALALSGRKDGQAARPGR